MCRCATKPHPTRPTLTLCIVEFPNVEISTIRQWPRRHRLLWGLVGHFPKFASRDCLFLHDPATVHLVFKADDGGTAEMPSQSPPAAASPANSVRRQRRTPVAGEPRAGVR